MGMKPVVCHDLLGNYNLEIIPNGRGDHLEMITIITKSSSECKKRQP